MADVAWEKKDERLLSQCETLWDDIVNRQMYVTGSIGSAAYGERFTVDYDLPNNINYSESCATIGLAMFSNRMFQNTRNGKYMDAVERALYNTLLSGVALDGRHYFYVNPLEVVPEIAENNPAMQHVKTERQLWFGVACCPPNITRTLASIGNYMIDVQGDTCYVNLYISSEITAPLKSGDLQVSLQANYPESETIHLHINKSANIEQTIAVRIPGYVGKQWEVYINGEKIEADPKDGYLYLSRSWKKGDDIQLKLNVKFRFVYCNPRVRNDIGRVCIMRGPVVYCFEEVDNGKYLEACRINTDQEIEERRDNELLGGTLLAEVSAEKIDYSKIGDDLYGINKPEYQKCTLKAVPYSSWNNRGKGEMQVWMRADDK